MTRSSQYWEVQEAVELELNFGERFVMQLDPEAIPHDVANFLDEVQDAQVGFSGNINAEVEDRRD